MWVNKHVNIPEELFVAYREGRLVLFAGAGVSVGPPSNYPSFYDLAMEVAQQVGDRITIGENEPIDRFFGRLKKRGVHVHHIVHAMMQDPNSKPTPLHHTLASLFQNADGVRIVTTNFDPHLILAAREEFEQPVPVYHAPALPLGHKFHGIVHVHGSVEGDADELVLTDEDFGRAYLTEGWARRFLSGMFENYVVLFVGYSHNDPIMQYLARGLPPHTLRYAFTFAGNEEHWRFLDVEPIVYPLVEDENEHRLLGESLEDFASYVKGGFLAHGQRIKRIVQSPPSPVAEEMDYIAGCLQAVPTTRLFVQYARRPEWLCWVEEKGFLNGEENETALLLTGWFAEHFVTSQSEDGLAFLQRNGRKAHPAIWGGIARSLVFRKEQTSAETFSRWVAVLVGYAGRSDAMVHDLLSLLEQCRYPDDRWAALLLFECLTQPVLEMEPSFFLVAEQGRKVRFDVRVKGFSYQIQEAWERLFRPHLQDVMSDLEPLLTKQLGKANQLLRAAGQAEGDFDPVSYGRYAIEPHEMDHHPEAVDVLIDAARDMANYLVAHRPKHAAFLLESWASSEVPLLKRLAIYGMTERTDVTPDEKIEWLLDIGWLFHPWFKHEVFRLLAQCYADASQVMRLRLLDAAFTDAETEAENKLRPRQRYDLLVWLNGYAPECDLARVTLEGMQQVYPEFHPHENPDAIWCMSGGFVEEMFPGLSPEDLLEQPMEETFEHLLLEKGSHDFYRPALVRTVIEAVRRSFDFGWGLAEWLCEREEWTSDLWYGIIGGWGLGVLEEDEWSLILGLLRKEKRLAVFSAAWGGLFVEQIRGSEVKLPPAVLAEAERAAWAVWESIDHAPEQAEEQEDWMDAAVHHVGGQLVEFWVYSLSAQLQEEKEKGIPEPVQGYLEAVLEAQSVAAQMGKVVLASQLFFLFGIDWEWTTQNLVPLFDWSKNSRMAQQAWHGYLTWGRWSEALLDRFMPCVEQSFAHLQDGLASRRDRFCEHLAGIAVYSTGQPVQGGWLSRFLVESEAADRQAWAKHLGHQLRSLPDEGKTWIWQKWLRSYWRDRVEEIPERLAPEEAGEMIYWALSLQPVFPEVVELILRMPAPPAEFSRVYFLLERTAYPEAFPTSLARLLLHLLREAGTPFYACDRVAHLLERLRKQEVSEELLTTIQEHVNRLGCAVE